MSERCTLFHKHHDWVTDQFVICNPDPHPHYITGTYSLALTKRCLRCNETWVSPQYDYWAECGFQDTKSYRYHDDPEEMRRLGDLPPLTDNEAGRLYFERMIRERDLTPEDERLLRRLLRGR